MPNSDLSDLLGSTAKPGPKRTLADTINMFPDFNESQSRIQTGEAIKDSSKTPLTVLVEVKCWINSVSEQKIDLLNSKEVLEMDSLPLDFVKTLI